ncbi:jg20600 [Pararge aegeria aegeria]|uniref:Jg20600 protein n=1 Tax=Pararge aegeria aegeria TaxID=348720 RepID=A0A8S4RU58_9NEOP|nr:jg20600 [Pararge aegeria aegeria]
MIFQKRYFCRGLSTTKVNRTSSLNKLKKLQADFQAEDGRPIWLKRGRSDRILSSLTFFLCYVGILMTLTTIYDNAKPSSWKTGKQTC